MQALTLLGWIILLQQQDEQYAALVDDTEIDEALGHFEAALEMDPADLQVWGPPHAMQCTATHCTACMPSSQCAVHALKPPCQAMLAKRKKGLRLAPPMLTTLLSLPPSVSLPACNLGRQCWAVPR